MKKVGGLFTCSALALMAFAALPLSAAELAHRWSFNGDYSDSVGGADAVKCGTYVSLYGGRVHMGYGACSHGTGYVDLGTNMLDTTAATIEIWARHDGVESWSRVFDYGADTANNVFLSWTFGTTLSKNQLGSKLQGAERKADYTTPYEIGHSGRRVRRAGMVACLHAAAYRIASRKVREVRKVISSGARASFPHFHIFIIPYFHNLSAVALAKVDSTISHFSWARVRPCP